MKGDNPCPLCRVNWNKKTQEEFELQVFDAVKDEYSVLGEYGGHNEKVLMIHNYCGHKWDVSPSNFIHNNSRCPKCSGNKSFPEQALYYYLSKKFPSVINSYSPEWIGKSEIDIFIPELNIGIEYDGVYYHKGKSKLNFNRV